MPRIFDRIEDRPRQFDDLPSVSTTELAGAMQKVTGAVVSAGAVLGMTVHVMNSVSSGDMATGTGAIAIFVTAITVLLSGRALRR